MSKILRILKQNKNTWLFIAFLLLGGVLHSNDPDEYPFLSTVFYCIEYLIYIGLILSWAQSVRERILPTRAKGYIMAATGLMLLFVAAQFTKYRISLMPGLTRYCWYVYYVPILLIPTLFLMTCFCLGKGADNKKTAELWFLVPSGLLSIGILTNDLHTKAFVPNDGILHHQAFLPNEGIAGLIGAPDTYTYGFLYYAVFIWAGCAMVTGIFLLLASCRKSGRWRKAIELLLFLALMPVLFTICNKIPKNSLPITYEFVEVYIFCMLGVFEASIRSRLIPSNENYPGFFAQMELSALITDRQLDEAFCTKSPVHATKEQLSASVNAPVYTIPGMRLSGMNIRAGYAFWETDESSLARLNEKLRDANEVLSQENEVMKREQELMAEQAAIEEHSRLYRQAAQEVYPTQKKISEILEKTRPDTASFRKDIEKTLVLTAYVKRKANFVLVEAERETVSVKELASALEESVHYLRYCGMNAAVDIRAERDFPCRMAMAAYDCFERAIEELLEKCEDLFIRLQDQELLMMAEGGMISEKEGFPALSGLPLPVCQSFTDGQLVFRFDLGASLEIQGGAV